MKKEIIILCIGVTILSSFVSAVVSTAISGHHKRPPFEQYNRNENINNRPQFEQKNRREGANNQPQYSQQNFNERGFEGENFNQ